MYQKCLCGTSRPPPKENQRKDLLHILDKLWLLEKKKYIYIKEVSSIFAH
jgi:hypothetical protein